MEEVTNLLHFEGLHRPTVALSLGPGFVAPAKHERNSVCSSGHDMHRRLVPSGNQISQTFTNTELANEWMLQDSKCALDSPGHKQITQD